LERMPSAGLGFAMKDQWKENLWCPLCGKTGKAAEGKVRHPFYKGLREDL
jgi:hypothetical protein